MSKPINLSDFDYLYIFFMLLQKQIQDFIKSNYLPSVIKQIPQDQDLSNGLLTLTVKIDMVKTLRQAREIRTFIFGNFIEFNQLI